VVLGEVGLVDQAHGHALGQLEVVCFPARAVHVHLHTPQHVGVPEVGDGADRGLTVSVGVVKHRFLRSAVAAVVACYVADVRLTHRHAHSSRPVVQLPGRTVSRQRSAVQQVGVPLGTGPTRRSHAGAIGEVEHWQLRSAVAAVVAGDVADVDRADIDALSSCPVVHLPGRTRRTERHAPHHIRVPLLSQGANRRLALAAGGVEDRRLGEALTAVVERVVGVVWLTHRHAALSYEDVALVDVGAGSVEWRALEEHAVPLVSTAADEGPAGEGGVVEDRPRLRAWFADLGSLVPDRRALGAQLAAERGGVPDRLDGGAVVGQQTLALLCDVVEESTVGTGRLAGFGGVVPDQAVGAQGDGDALVHTGVKVVPGRAHQNTLAEEDLPGGVRGAGHALAGTDVVKRGAEGTGLAGEGSGIPDGSVEGAEGVGGLGWQRLAALRCKVVVL
jgi:hypothetical protein